MRYRAPWSIKETGKEKKINDRNKYSKCFLLKYVAYED